MKKFWRITKAVLGWAWLILGGFAAIFYKWVSRAILVPLTSSWWGAFLVIGSLVFTITQFWYWCKDMSKPRN